MKPYSQFQPTGFDHKGLGLRDQQHWLVCPCSITRDSGPLDLSNWSAQLKALGGESDDVEIHRFGHWGPGWFEIVIINPDRSDLVVIAESLESSLADYPVLDDSDYSSREWNDYVETWRNCSMTRQFAREIAKAFNLLDSTKEALEDFDDDAMRSFYESMIPSGDYYETCDNGANFGNRLMHAIKRMERDDLARFIRANRKNNTIQTN